MIGVQAMQHVAEPELLVRWEERPGAGQVSLVLGPPQPCFEEEHDLWVQIADLVGRYPGDLFEKADDASA